MRLECDDILVWSDEDRWHCVNNETWTRWRHDRIGQADRGSLPDLQDPATLGCLLALVRDAWGDQRAYLCDYGGYDSIEWGVVSHEWDAKRQAESPKAWFSCLLGDSGTEAGALVRALEAAP